MKLFFITILLAMTIPAIGFAGTYKQNKADRYDFKLIHHEYQPRNFQ